ncbi:MAG: family 43 glycosylhydrolase [Cyanobacteria bacterium SZAS LIN-3]|nr:family 43 glycosylhydrolase [Cyanobacteria bacterium SZAS LIN-3]MBS2005610.1 family 43 glycosylhydrolase [Cyanobacteria bacterium SZAS TMP-1]
MHFLNLVAAALSVAAVQAPLTYVKRLSDTPILTPRAGKFDDLAAYNPTAVKVGSKTILLYRGQNKKGTSQIGYAESADGIHFTASDEPVLSPETDYEKDGGIEDPRLVKIGATYYLTYTGYNKTDAQLCLATSADLKHWQRVGIIMPANKGTWNEKWTKSGAILTKKINGKYWMYYLGTAGGADQMGVASSTDLKHWLDATKTPVLPKRDGMFDSRVVEPGPAPLLTDDGILLIYNGADDKLVYRTGWVLFDKKDPTRVIARSETPIFVPEKKWEVEGQVPNVVFVEGLTQDGKTLKLYYGAGDTSTGVLECTLAD